MATSYHLSICSEHAILKERHETTTTSYSGISDCPGGKAYLIRAVQRHIA